MTKKFKVRLVCTLSSAIGLYAFILPIEAHAQFPANAVSGYVHIAGGDPDHAYYDQGYNFDFSNPDPKTHEGELRYYNNTHNGVWIAEDKARLTGTSLGVFAQASAYAFSINGAPSTRGGTPSDAWVGTGADAGRTDTIRITSSTLALGTPVSFDFTNYLEGQMFGDTSDFGKSLLEAKVGLTASQGYFEHNGESLTSISNTMDYYPADGQVRAPFSYIWHGQVGDEVQIAYSMSARASADESNPYADPQGFQAESVGFYDTDQFFIKSLTPGADYISASGLTYQTNAPVPEASSMVLMGIGTGFLGCLMLRHRKKFTSGSTT